MSVYEKGLNARSRIFNPLTIEEKKHKHSSKDNSPEVFADIYQEDINITIWQRNFSASLKSSINNFLIENPNFQFSQTVKPDTVLSNLNSAFDATNHSELIEDVAELVDIFCFLLETKCTGLRLTVLDRAMCPKFHVDRVPCRLVTTYHGIATQWLPHHQVDRTKLGLGSKGLEDNESGLYQHHDHIQHLDCADVSILKGETWINNENAGLVHRSPSISNNEKRLLLTLDCVS